MTIGHYIYIASVSGYYSKLEWQSWADRQIMNRDKVEDWIYKVSLAKDIDELCNAVNEKMLEESYYDEHKSSPSDAIVGYYYMQYIEKRIGLYNLIDRLSNEDDISAASSINECADFYGIFKEIGANENLSKDKDFLQSIYNLFSPFKIIAEQQKRELENY